MICLTKYYLSSTVNVDCSERQSSQVDLSPKSEIFDGVNFFQSDSSSGSAAIFYLNCWKSFLDSHHLSAG